MDLAPTRTDLAYGDDSAAQRLDLWLPAGSRGPAPLVVFVHGGGWAEGSRTEAAPKVPALLTAGFAVASVDYRLSGEAPFPAAVDDVAAAVRFLGARAATFGLDPARVALWGESAGANVALVVGTLGGQVPPWGPGGAFPAVAAVVDWFGPTDLAAMDDHAAEIGCETSSHSADDSPESRYLGTPLRSAPELARRAGPLPHLVRVPAAGLPAVAIGHGTADRTVAPAQSRLLVEALQDRGVDPWVTWLEGAGHADPRFDAELLRPTVEWLARVLAQAEPRPVMAGRP